ncbi:hypothetical protein HNR77_000019 [Paenibacillus sp. JGP012]|nr:hypothetical protein [Paenibacillus sp. JGP012]
MILFSNESTLEWMSKGVPFAVRLWHFKVCLALEFELEINRSGPSRASKVDVMLRSAADAE